MNFFTAAGYQNDQRIGFICASAKQFIIVLKKKQILFGLIVFIFIFVAFNSHMRIFFRDFN